MRGLIIIFLFHFAFTASAADTSHEAAARKFFSAMMKTNKPGLAQALGAFGSSAESRKVAIEALESQEFEAVYVRNLVKTFSEQELSSLVEMANTPAYRLYSERSSIFLAKMAPELATFYRNFAAESVKRTEDKNRENQEKAVSCRDERTSQIPEFINSNLSLFPFLEGKGYNCSEVQEDKLAKLMYVSCRRPQPNCRYDRIVSLRLDMTTLKVDMAYDGPHSATILGELTRQGRLTPGVLPQKVK